MNRSSLPTALLDWAERALGGRVESWTIEEMAGGAVAKRVERIRLRSASAECAEREVVVVRKDAFDWEVAALLAAQAIRPAAPAIPELAASGKDGTQTWMVTAWCPGAPLQPGVRIPASVIESLARLHAHRHGAVAELDACIPRIGTVWWRQLCEAWVEPAIASNTRHGAETLARAAEIVMRAAGDPAVESVIGRLTPTLLHGDVHPGNVIVEGERAALIDWGGARVGSAMLDIGNVCRRESDEFGVYADAWLALTGRPLGDEQVELGYRWAALQLPVQYLPWALDHRSTAELEAVLDRIEAARAALSA